MPVLGQPPVHAHSGNGLGGQLDWDDVWSDAVHSHASNAEGGTVAHGDLGSVTSDQHHAQTHAATHATGGADPLTVAAIVATLFRGADYQVRILAPGAAWVATAAGSGLVTHRPSGMELETGPTASSSLALSSGALQAVSRGQTRVAIDWTKATFIAVSISVAQSVATGIVRLQWGRLSNATDLADLDARGYGVKITDLALAGLAHNGTTLTTTATLATLVANRAYMLVIVSDGAGNIEWFLDGVSIGTSAGGPAAVSDDNYNAVQLTTENGATATQRLLATGPVVVGVAQ